MSKTYTPPLRFFFFLVKLKVSELAKAKAFHPPDGDHTKYNGKVRGAECRSEKEDHTQELHSGMSFACKYNRT